MRMTGYKRKREGGRMGRGRKGGRWKRWNFREEHTGWPRNNGTVDTVDFSGLCSNQQLFSSPCWIEHLFPIIITPRSSNLVENFLFYETFLMDCHFRDLPDFQSFEAR